MPPPVVLARNAERNLAVIHDIDENTAHLDLTLQPGLTLTVKVQDADGKPIPTAMGTLVVRDAGWNLNQMPVMADDQGLIEIKGLPPGQHYSGTITSRGYGLVNVDAPIEVTKTTHFELPAAVLRLADRELAGRVLDQDGDPVTNAIVGIQDKGQLTANTTTDVQGGFAFYALCEGTCGRVPAPVGSPVKAQPGASRRTNVVTRWCATLSGGAAACGAHATTI